MFREIPSTCRGVPLCAPVYINVRTTLRAHTEVRPYILNRGRDNPLLTSPVLSPLRYESGRAERLGGGKPINLMVCDFCPSLLGRGWGRGFEGSGERLYNNLIKTKQNDLSYHT